MSDSPTWPRVQELLGRALDLEPAARSAFLREACGHDPALHAEVVSLLDAHARAGSLGEPFAALAPSAVASSGRVLRVGDRLGPYEILSPLGAGGMGEVYEAQDPRLGRRVAIKVLSADLTRDATARARFDREAKAIAALNHRHICTVHDIGHEDGIDFIVMERLEGETLATRLMRGTMPYQQALPVAIAIADALNAAHREGIVHRDLKPGNVMLTKEGAKLLDFGLAKTGAAAHGPREDAPTALATATASGTIVGTIQYMAPEQLEGRDADARSDVFAFGALVFEMLTGRKAFAGATQANVISAILRDDPPAVSTVTPLASPALDRAIRKCLAKNADARWQSVGDLADELRWIAEPRPSETRSVPVRSRAFSRIAVPLFAALLGVTATWAFMRSADRASTDAPLSFVIPPPDGVTWGDTPPEPHPAVSPDGRKVAFAGESPEGNGLWIRDLGETRAQLVPASMDFGGPRSGVFWSSDSKRVGYCVRNSLKIHSFDGRSPQLLEVGCTGGFASWNQAGDILFRRDNGIFRISEGGGQATQVTSVDSSRELRHNFPRWLPDGRRFIYTVIGPNADASGIYASAVDGSPPRRVLPDVSKSDFVTGEDGASYLVFVRQSQLIAQPIDVARVAPGGDGRVVAERMAIGNVAMPSFSASAALLVHRSGGSSRRSAWVWIDRQGRLVDSRDTGRQGAPSAALSPDGSTFVYAPTTRDGSTNGLWMVDFDRRVEQQVFDNPRSAMLPGFSRNGRRIAFTAIEPGARRL